MKSAVLKRAARLGLATTLGMSLLAAGFGPAAAAPPGEVGFMGGETSLERQLQEKLESVETILSATGDEVVTSAGTEMDGISVSLPGSAVSPEAVDIASIPDGLFHGEAAPLLSTQLPEAKISAYATGYGNQSIITIEGHNAPQEYRFNLSLPEGSTTELDEDGSVRITGVDGDLVGIVHVPWAYDANGTQVATSFSLEGSELVQRIGHDASNAYPVHADPSVQWIPYPVLALYGYEIRTFSTIAVALASGGAWAGCTFSKLSGIPGKIVSQICTVVGIAGVMGVVNTVRDAWGSASLGSWSCYGITLFNSRAPLVSMPARDCQY